MPRIRHVPSAVITPFSSRGEALAFPRALNAGERIAVHMVVTHHPKGPY
jgi:hypothetical protein